MEGNMMFYIKYQDHRPVGVKTHYHPDGKARDRVITSVSQLIAAYKKAVAPRFDFTPLDELTLHNWENGPTIPGNTPLDSIEQPAGSYPQPLIIRSSSDTITLEEFMKLDLPPARYFERLPSPSSTDVFQPRKPDHIFDWMGFENDVQRWVDANRDEHLQQRIAKPVFLPLDKQRIIASEVPQLHPFIEDNLLSLASNCCSDCEFVSWSIIDQDPNVRGKPDFGQLKNGELAAPIEVKGPWTLPRPDIVNDMDTHVQSAIVQIYTYMRHNHRKFGILTSYDYTWFCCRKPCAEENLCPIAGHEAIYISPGIPFRQMDHKRPHILQCFGYFGSIVTSAYEYSPPSTHPAPTNGSATAVNLGVAVGSEFPREHGLTTGSVTASRTSAVTRNPFVEQSFDVDDFQFQSILGLGRARVCYDDSLGLAIKHADVWKNPDMLSELRNEVEIYNTLVDLQGRFIPKMQLFGHWQGSYCVGFTVHGTNPKTLDSVQKQNLIHIMDMVHGYGVIHGDIKKENILVDACGHPFLIDFGFARKNGSPQDFENERNQLIRCLELL